MTPFTARSTARRAVAHVTPVSALAAAGRSTVGRLNALIDQARLVPKVTPSSIGQYLDLNDGTPEDPRARRPRRRRGPRWHPTNERIERRQRCDLCRARLVEGTAAMRHTDGRLAHRRCVDAANALPIP